MATRTTPSGFLAAPAAMAAIALTGPVVQPSFGTAFAQPRPNVVMIMADGLGWSDVSTGLTNLGNPSDFYETPTIDRLASEGMAFTNAYASGPNSSPTRSALLTGQYAARPDNNIFATTSLDRGGSGSLLVGPTQGLPDTGEVAIPQSAFTHAEMLKDNGYVTANVGKFHVSEMGSAETGFAPLIIREAHGFDANFGGSAAGGPEDYFAADQQFSGSISPSLDEFAGDYTQAYVNNNIKPFAVNTPNASINQLVGTDKHVTDALADAALQFMDINKADPFFVQLNSYAVNLPVNNAQARGDLLTKYQAKPPGVSDSNAAYAALIEGFDQSIARVIDYLETTPDPDAVGQTLAENTLVVVYSDSGGREPQANTGPLRGQKGELSEGGIRVPMVVWSGNPDLVDGGTINPTPVTTVDFYTTFGALAGAELDGMTLDGEDLSGLFADSGATLDRDSLYWHFPGYVITGGLAPRNQRPQSAIRSGDWKLLYNYEDQSFELYDLANDLGETTDVASANPEVVRALAGDLIAWLDETDAPLATLREGELNLIVSGEAYANGEVVSLAGELLTISAGEELPIFLPAILPGSLLAGDYNGDGVVNAGDYTVWRRSLGDVGVGLAADGTGPDGTPDGVVDIFDYRLWTSSFGNTAGSGPVFGSAAAPEPAAAWLLAALALQACAGGRRRHADL